MKKNNIIFFTWENKIFLKKELDRWIQVFEDKHSSFNISRITLENIDKISIESELTTMPFLSENRLIILEEIPLSWSPKDTENTKDAKFDEKILNILDSIPESNFVIFVQENPDKRKSLYKKLIEISTIKEFINPNENELKKYIRERLIGIDNEALNKLIEFKNSKFIEIEWEIEKLILFKNHEKVSKEDIEKYITPEIESNIFSFTDWIFELNYNKALSNLGHILDNSKIEPTFAAIMTNIRKFLYTLYLKNSWIPDSQIIELLKLHPFVFKKTISKSSSYKEILKFYNELVNIEIKAKIGNLIGDNEAGLKLALEKVILDLKKNKIHLQ